MNIHIATLSDFDGLTTLYRHLVPNDITAPEETQRDTFSAMLAHPGMSMLIGSVEGLPVTTCTLIIAPNLTRGCAPYALIENVVTHRDHRGHKYGEQILKAAFDRAWQARCYKIMLLSGATNKAAHRFYERLGFSSTKQGFELRSPRYPSRMLT